VNESARLIESRDSPTFPVARQALTWFINPEGYFQSGYLPPLPIIPLGMAETPAETATLYEDDRSTPSRHASRHVDGVVLRAEAEFNALSRQLTNHSAHKATHSDKKDHSMDIEKAHDNDGDRFDLREYLTSSNDANQAAGIKHKVRHVDMWFLG